MTRGWCRRDGRELQLRLFAVALLIDGYDRSPLSLPHGLDELLGFFVAFLNPLRDSLEVFGHGFLLFWPCSITKQDGRRSPAYTYKDVREKGCRSLPVK